MKPHVSAALWRRHLTAEYRAGVSGARPLRVVLADDHLVVRAGLRLLMGSERDLEVVAEAHDVASTLTAVRTFRPAVLVLDITMGSDSALWALPELLDASPQTRILLLTMHDDPGFARAAMRSGAHGYLLKDAAANELLTAVREVAAGGTYLSPTLGARLAADSGAQGELTDRETEVLGLVASGYTNQQIAERLYVSLRTVEAHRARIRQKLGLDTRAALNAYAREHGLIA